MKMLYVKRCNKYILYFLYINSLSSLHKINSLTFIQLIEKYFPNTPSRIEGIGLYEVEQEVAKRHSRTFKRQNISGNLELEIGGDYRWRRNGEKHMFNPLTIAKLQDSVRQNNPKNHF